MNTSSNLAFCIEKGLIYHVCFQSVPPPPSDQTKLCKCNFKYFCINCEKSFRRVSVMSLSCVCGLYPLVALCWRLRDVRHFPHMHRNKSVTCTTYHLPTCSLWTRLAPGLVQCVELHSNNLHFI